MHTDKKKFLISPGCSIKTAMKQLDLSHGKILFLIDERNKLIGSLSDGDIRRWILSGGDLESKVENACHLHPFSVTKGYDTELVKKEILDKKFSAVPILDFDGSILDILFWDEILEDSKWTPEIKVLDCDVLIMAGGQGSRLEPFTKILPKPLIPIGDKAIIELIIDKFLKFSVKHFYISIYHKAKIIKSYFEEQSPSYLIDYLEEEMQLGTIGALSLLKGKLNKPLIVANCDVLIDIDYAEFLEFHQNNKFDISIIASVVHHKIPYGICEIENGGILTKLIEKPEYSFLVSTGMYIINPNLIDLIPQNTFYHVTEFIDKVQSQGGKIGVFPISANSWVDTGEWHEYKKTLERFKV